MIKYKASNPSSRLCNLQGTQWSKYCLYTVYVFCFDILISTDKFFKTITLLIFRFELGNPFFNVHKLPRPVMRILSTKTTSSVRYSVSLKKTPWMRGSHWQLRLTTILTMVEANIRNQSIYVTLNKLLTPGPELPSYSWAGMSILEVGAVSIYYRRKELYRSQTDKLSPN
jgi:hypothetical protein